MLYLKPDTSFNCSYAALRLFLFSNHLGDSGMYQHAKIIMLIVDATKDCKYFHVVIFLDKL
jgi:hypothetical protein